jgi:nitronate monooxygenase
MVFRVEQLAVPIVQAPMAGGLSTVPLTVAVGEAGGLGFLAGGYRSAETVAADIAAVRSATVHPFGVNLFSPSELEAPASVVEAYARELAAEEERFGISLGEPRFDDDGYEVKLEMVARERVPVVSFTFGCPSREAIAAFHANDIAVWVTVTNPDEAQVAEAAGADALVAQGMEAGGHRGSFDDQREEDYGMVVLLRLLAARTQLPLIAAGGIADGAGVAAVLCAGASAAQLGTALMLTPEAGTSALQRARLAQPTPTRLTRAFSGRRARAIVNRFMEAHEEQAPSAYPQVNSLTAPIRAAAREAGDLEAVNLFAGQGHSLARDVPAGELVRNLAAETKAVLAETFRQMR